jgi:hypothetical protein
MDLLPPTWSNSRQRYAAALILAALRGLLADVLTSANTERANGALEVLVRALDADEHRTP